MIRNTQQPTTLNYDFRCEPVDRSTLGKPLYVRKTNLCFLCFNYFIYSQIAQICWWFLMFKFTDLFETLILVFGKRHELITKYHVAHHFLMPK